MTISPLKIIAPIVTLALFIGTWELLVKVQDIQVLLLPAPDVIFRQVIDNFSTLLEFSWNTTIEAMKGLALATLVAIPLAWLVHGRKFLASGLNTYSAALKALPIVALYPIVTVFFGITSTAVVAIVAVGIFPIMFSYALTGFQGSSELDDLMRSISAGPIRRFWNMTLPRSLPYLLTALKTSLPLSVIIAIIAQYFGGSVVTLGSYIRRESANLHTVQMWSAIFMSCVVGLLAFAVGAALDRLLLAWHPSHQ
jgi:NitT/TauT family transport system permease protein